MDFFGIRAKSKAENAVQINEVSQQYSWSYMPWVFHHKDKKEKPLGNVYFQAIMNLIWNGISNITYDNSGKPSLTLDAITQFIDANATLLVNQYLRLGFIAVFYDDKGNYRIPQDSELKYDKYNRVINKYCVVIYSPQYQAERTSLFRIAFPMIAWINKLAGSNDYLADTFGMFGVLSSPDIPLSPQGKKQLLESIQENYGSMDDRFPFMLMNHDAKWTPVQPDAAKLAFSDQIKDAYKILCNLFGVPTQLLFDDNSTYNNVKEARIAFYDTTIRSYAEILLKVAQALLVASNDFIPKNSLNYHFTNIPELEKSLSSAVEERTAWLEYLIKLRDAGMDVEKELNDLYRESKDLPKNV